MIFKTSGDFCRFCHHHFLLVIIFPGRNPGVPTIEEELLEALTKAGAFPEEMKDNLGKVSLTFNLMERALKGLLVINSGTSDIGTQY